MGNCLAGDTCVFSHDPSKYINRLAIDGDASAPLPTMQSNLQLQDYSSFPSLQPSLSDQWSSIGNPVNVPGSAQMYPNTEAAISSSGLMGVPSPLNFDGVTQPMQIGRHQSREPTPSVPSVDDTEAFPSLGAATIKSGKKHHGKRGGHGHGHKDAREAVPNSLADIVRMSPSPGPAQIRKGARAPKNGCVTATQKVETSAAALAIPSPKHIPWLETGERANKQYLKARQDAIKHGGLRNKFLQRLFRFNRRRKLDGYLRIFVS